MKVLVLFLIVIILATCKADDTRVHPACKEPQVKEPCDNSQNIFEFIRQRAYYDPVEKKCKKFTLKGCGYVANLFGNLQQCQDFCEKTPEELCSLPLQQSSGGFACMAFGYAYYYKASEKKCEKFQYGGCGGNQNNFGSAKQCEEFCGNV